MGATQPLFEVITHSPLTTGIGIGRRIYRFPSSFASQLRVLLEIAEYGQLHPNPQSAVCPSEYGGHDKKGFGRLSRMLKDKINDY